MTLTRSTMTLARALRIPVWSWFRKKKVPASEKQDHRQEADRDHVDVFPEEKHAELHPRVLGVKAADQLLFRLREVER